MQQDIDLLALHQLVEPVQLDNVLAADTSNKVRMDIGGTAGLELHTVVHTDSAALDVVQEACALASLEGQVDLVAGLVILVELAFLEVVVSLVAVVSLVELAFHAVVVFLVGSVHLVEVESLVELVQLVGLVLLVELVDLVEAESLVELEFLVESVFPEVVGFLEQVANFVGLANLAELV